MITFYDCIKSTGAWRIRALSVCFPPIVITSAEYKTKAQAQKAAKTAAGLNGIPMAAYLEAVTDFKTKFVIE